MSPPLVLLYRHMNPVHALPSYSIKIKYYIILPPRLRSFKWLLSFIIPCMRMEKTASRYGG
jgi:hypothetical protein